MADSVNEKAPIRAGVRIEALGGFDAAIREAFVQAPAKTTAHYAVSRHVGKRKLLGVLPTQENGYYLWTNKQNYLRSRTGDSGETPRFAFALTVSGMGAEDLLGVASARIASI